MDNEENENIPFQIILHAGESKADSFLAMQSARKGDFEEADKYMKTAIDELQQAHQIQTNMMVKEANGEKIGFSVMFVHAQDHLSMAIFAKDIAKEYIEGFKLFYERGLLK